MSSRELIGAWILASFLQFRGLEEKHDKAKPSYLIEIHRKIGCLLHILVHPDSKLGHIILKLAVCIVYNIWQGIDGDQRPLSYLLLPVSGP